MTETEAYIAAGTYFIRGSAGGWDLMLQGGAKVGDLDKILILNSPNSYILTYKCVKSYMQTSVTRRPGTSVPSRYKKLKTSQ